MPKVRALKPMFHGGSLRPIGAVFELTDEQVKNAAERLKDRQIRPAFELVPVAKTKAAPASDLV